MTDLLTLLVRWLECATVLGEWMEGDTVEYRNTETQYKQLFEANQLGVRFPIGLKERIESFDARQLREFYHEHYRPENMTLYLVGSLRPSRVIRQIHQIFSGGVRPPLSLDASLPVADTLPYTPVQIVHSCNKQPSQPICIAKHDLTTQFSLCFTQVRCGHACVHVCLCLCVCAPAS